jgi:hypothetical protein
MVDVTPAKTNDGVAAPKAPPAPAPSSSSEPRPKPAIFVPERPPDDPGVAQGESDESPTSLERLRAAQIR